MTTLISLRENGACRYYITHQEKPIPESILLYGTITQATREKQPLMESFMANNTNAREIDSETMYTTEADQYIILDFENLLMAEYRGDQHPFLHNMPNDARIAITDLRNMIGYRYTLANLLHVERSSHEWLGHANSDMKNLPLKGHCLYLLEDWEMEGWEDVLNSKVVSAKQLPGSAHKVFMVTGISPYRLSSFHSLLCEKIEQAKQWDIDREDIVAAAKTTRFMSLGTHPEELYPWEMAYCENLDDVLYNIKDDYWTIRTCFVWENLAFIQQVDGGDEWLALRKSDGIWAPFESLSIGHMIENHGIDGTRAYMESLSQPSEPQMEDPAPMPDSPSLS